MKRLMTHILCKEFALNLEKSDELLKGFQRSKLIRITIWRDYTNYTDFEENKLEVNLSKIS